MTVNRLRRLLDEMIRDGHGHKRVVVNKPTFRHNLEADGCVLLDVYTVECHLVLQIGDDGGAKINKDGSESYKQCVVLGGASAEPGSLAGGEE